MQNELCCSEDKNQVCSHLQWVAIFQILLIHGDEKQYYAVSLLSVCDHSCLKTGYLKPGDLYDCRVINSGHLEVEGVAQFVGNKLVAAAAVDHRMSCFYSSVTALLEKCPPTPAICLCRNHDPVLKNISIVCCEQFHVGTFFFPLNQTQQLFPLCKRTSWLEPHVCVSMTGCKHWWYSPHLMMQCFGLLDVNCRKKTDISADFHPFFRLFC